MRSRQRLGLLHVGVVPEREFVLALVRHANAELAVAVWCRARNNRHGSIAPDSARAPLNQKVVAVYVGCQPLSRLLIHRASRLKVASSAAAVQPVAVPSGSPAAPSHGSRPPLP